jgi:hypothetical protein
MHTITGYPVKTHPKPALIGGMWVQIKISKSWTMQAELYELGKGTGGFRVNVFLYDSFNLGRFIVGILSNT